MAVKTRKSMLGHAATCCTPACRVHCACIAPQCISNIKELLHQLRQKVTEVQWQLDRRLAR